MQDFDQEGQLFPHEQKLNRSLISSAQYLIKPSGEYSVGYQKNKELNATIYYPSLEKIDSGSPSKLVEKIKSDIKEHQVNVSEGDSQSLDSVKTYSQEGLVVVPNQMFPVIIFSPGSKSIAGYYENTISDLVSRGYIVIARDNIHNPDLHTDRQASEKKPKEVLSEIISIRQSISQLSKENPVYAAMNIDQVGLLGHSMGGAMSILAAQQHPNLFQSVAALDAPVDLGIRRIVLTTDQPKRPLEVGALYIQKKMQEDGQIELYYSTNSSDPSPLKHELAEKVLESKESSTPHQTKLGIVELTAASHPELFQQIVEFCNQEAYLWDIRREVKIPSLQMHATTWKLNYSGQAPDEPFHFNQNTTHILLGTDESDKHYSCHNNFKDNSTLQDHPASQALEQVFIGIQQQYPGSFGDVRTPIQTGTINGVEASKTISECVGQFFDTSLKKKATPIFSEDQPLKNTMVTRGDYIELSEIKPLRASSRFGSAMFTPPKQKSSEETSVRTFQESPRPETPNI